MTTQPPPSRFKVVERGRRLEVIDTQAGDAPTRSARRPAAAPQDRPAGWWPCATRFDGTVEFETRAFYDEKAPRRITLDPGTAQRLGYARWVVASTVVLAVVVVLLQPWLLVGTLALANPALRARLRGWTTRLVDRATLR